MPSLRIKRFAICILLLLSALFAAGCQRATPTPTAAPPATATPTSTPTPPATATPTTAPPTPTSTPQAAAPVDWTVFVDESRGFTLTHPAHWTVLAGEELDLDALLGKLNGVLTEEEAARLLAQFSAMPARQEVLAAVGLRTDKPEGVDRGFTDNFTLFVLPAGLSLETYRQLVALQLSGLEQVHMQAAEVVAGLRPNGLEAASLRYTVDGSLYGLPASLMLEGWQVAFLDPRAEHLYILTFVVDAEAFPSLEPVFRTMVQDFVFR